MKKIGFLLILIILALFTTTVFADVLYTPRSVDLMGLPYESPIDHRSVYYRSGNDIQNPLWTTKYASSIDNVNRVYGSGNLSYEILDNLNLSYRYGIDHYAEEYIGNHGNKLWTDDGRALNDMLPFFDSYLKFE